MQSENRSNLSQSYCTWGCMSRQQCHLGMIWFCLTNTVLKSEDVFWCQNPNDTERCVHKHEEWVWKGLEWKNALAAKRKEPIIRLQMDGIIANSVARRILHFVQRLSLGGLLCLHSVWLFYVFVFVILKVYGVTDCVWLCVQVGKVKIFARRANERLRPGGGCNQQIGCH